MELLQSFQSSNRWWSLFLPPSLVTWEFKDKFLPTTSTKYTMWSGKWKTASKILSWKGEGWETYTGHWFTAEKKPYFLLRSFLFTLDLFLKRSPLSLILSRFACSDIWDGFPCPFCAMVSFAVEVVNYFLLGGSATFIICFMNIQVYLGFLWNKMQHLKFWPLESLCLVVQTNRNERKS